MRLLDTQTGRLRWVEDPRQVHYAILSHVWSKESDPDYVPEQTYEDLKALVNSVDSTQDMSILPRLSEKLQNFCRVASEDGFELGWVDTCCIDKSSSAELSEAINSMYDWYSFAGRCYAYLKDVSPLDRPCTTTPQSITSKWFKRGWTLQELLAPRDVVFLSQDWKTIGSKHNLASVIATVTGINADVLTFQTPVSSVSVACRMSWAASRTTSRTEDEAYSLLGLFELNMPLMYGEGRRAFIRLQEEILKTIPDQTIFAWGNILSDYAYISHRPARNPVHSVDAPLVQSSPLEGHLLSLSPRDFKDAQSFVPLSPEEYMKRLGISVDDIYRWQLYTTTAYGIHIKFPLLHPSVDEDVTLAILACQHSSGLSGLLALLLRPSQQGSRAGRYFVGVNTRRDQSRYCRLIYLPPPIHQDSYAKITSIMRLKEICIPHRPPRAQVETTYQIRGMRLLNTRTGQFLWVKNPRQVCYAILSHVWAQKGDADYVPEQTYKDVVRIQNRVGPNESVLPYLSEKIRKFCQVAQDGGFDFGWVDTCCIDKTSAPELSEAINSMWNWYRYADACYAILRDVRHAAPDRVDEFRASKWFKRGWTLQELLAPSVVIFLSCDWQAIGTKHELASLVENVSGVERTVLTLDTPVEDVSVARRMSWAASRQTTVEEDRAYSLMGIFGVNMQITYGEGRHAFIRLQEDIIKRIPDQTMFAWGPVLRNPSSHLASLPFARFHPLYEGLLARSPKDFESCSDATPMSREDFATLLGISADNTYQTRTPSVTSHGIEVWFHIVAVPMWRNISLALLACKDSQGRCIALILRPKIHASGTDHSVGISAQAALEGSPCHYRTTYLNPQQFAEYIRQNSFQNSRISVPHPMVQRLERVDDPGLREGKHDFKVRLSGWSRNLLALQGYRVSPAEADADIGLEDQVLSRKSQPGVVIYNREHNVAIQVGRCNCDFGARFGLLGVLVSSPSGVYADRSEEGPHTASHPVHINSWAVDGGVATKEVTFKFAPGQRPDKLRATKNLTTRLTFTQVNRTRNATLYYLGVELGFVRSTGLADSDRPAMIASRLASLPDSLTTLRLRTGSDALPGSLSLSDDSTGTLPRVSLTSSLLSTVAARLPAPFTWGQR